MVKRLQKTDTRAADALRYGVILRRFDLPALQALLPNAGLDLPWYERFVDYTFLRQVADGYAFHEQVRRVQLAWLQRQAPAEGKTHHHRALAHYESRLETGVDKGRRWAWELEALYHHWAVAPDEALGDWQARVNDAWFHWRREPWLALLELAEAAKRDVGLARRAEGQLMHEWGAFYQRWTKWEEALEWYERSVALKEELGDKAGLAASYNNIGSVHQDWGDYGAALEWYGKSVALGEELGNKAGLAASYNNIAFVHQARGEIEQAIALFERSLAILKELGARANAETVRRNLADARARKT
jgi:tetratricopeptide (TPR) repeat protein